MSKQVDERVVSMQFDNRQFEANVKTSMSTIDKLKEKLHFKGASKGLENVNSAAKNVNMSGLSGAVETVRSRFSALEVMGVTALMNITNSAVNAGKRIVSALTIDPVKTGFSEYETKINAIQTIMSNTASKGTTMADVTRVLDELNTYADKTIYNFAEMTRNIGTFTAAGVGLEDSAAAIQGIANLAAASGSTSQQASTAMYQLSQALSTGTVRLMDWNSVVNAGMGGEKFQNALKETAREHGVAVDDMIKKAGSFRDSLSDEWLTADILNETLRKFTVDGAAKYADAMVKSGKYTQEQADALKNEAQNMEDAATKVKTFTQLMDTMKESVQSGWAKTWELLFGDFEEARSFFSDLSARFGKIIDGASEARNSLIEGAFTSKWKTFDSLLEKTNVSVDKFKSTLKETAKENGVDVDALIEKYDTFDNALAAGAISSDIIRKAIDKLCGSEKNAVKSTEDANDALEKFQKVVNEVWHGDYGNGEARVKALTEAGYKYAEVQDLVNKTVDGHKLTLEDLSDAQLKNIGCTDEQIKSINELEKVAQESGVTLDELIEQMGKPSGRYLLIDSLRNALQGLGAVFGSIGQAWKDIFAPQETKEKAASLYNFLEGLNNLSKKLVVSEDAAKNFRRTFKGVFALLDIICTLVAGPIKIAFKLLTAILAEFDLNILDVTASIGDALVAFRDWIDRTLDFKKAAQWLVDPIKKAIKAFKEWIATLKESDNIPRDIVKGLVNGLGSGLKFIGEAAMALGKKIIEVIKNVLGIHSPSTVMFALGGFAALGLILGFKDKLAALFPDAAATVEGFISNIKGTLAGVDWGLVFAGAMSAGTLGVVNKFANAFETLASPFEGLADVLSGAGKVIFNFSKTIKNFNKILGAFAFKMISKSLINLAIAVAILVAAVIALTLVPQEKLLGAVSTVLVITAALAGVLAMLSKLSEKLGDFKESGTKAAFIAALGITILAVAGAVLMLGKMNTDELIKGGIAVGVLSGVLVGLMASTKLLTKYGYKVKNLDKVGTMFRKIAFSLLLMAAVIKIFGIMPLNELIQGGIAMAAIIGVYVGVMAATKLLSGDQHKLENIDKVGKMFRKIAFSLLLIAGVIKIFGTMPRGELIQGGIVVASIIAVYVGIMAATKLLSNQSSKIENIDKVGKLFSKIAFSLLLIAAAIKIFGTMPRGELIQGGIVAGTIIATFVGIMAATKLLSKSRAAMQNVGKVGGLVLGMSASLLLIALALKIFGRMPINELIQGGSAIIVLLGTMVGVMAATKLLSTDKTAMSSLKQVGVMMLMLAGAVTILAFAMFIITKLDPNRLGAALGSIVLLIASFAGVMAATKLLKGTRGAMGVLTRCMIAIGILVAALIGLSFINPDRLRNTALSLMGVMAALALLIAATAMISKTSASMSPKNIAKGALAISLLIVPLAALAGVLILMSTMNVQEAIPNAIALGGMLVVMTGIAALVGALGKNAKNIALGSASILALVAVVAALGLVLAMMSALEVENAFANGVVLSAMLLILVGIAALVGILGKNLKNIALGSVALLALVAVVAAIGLVLAMMSALDVQNAIPNAKALITLTTALTLLLIPLSLIGLLITATGGMALLGVVGLLALAIPLAAFVGILALMAKVENAITNAYALTYLMTTLGDLLIKLSILGPLALVGVVAMQGLILLMTELGLLAVAVGALVSKFPQLQEFLDVGIGLFERLANGIGSIIGNLIAGFMDAIANSLPGIGANLSLFMTNLAPFIAGVKMVDESVLGGVGRLAASILLLTAAELINGIASFFGGGTSLVTLGQELSTFMQSIGPFIAGASMLNEEMMAGVRALAETILILTAANILEGLSRFFGMGEGSLQTFGQQLPMLGYYMQQFVTQLGTFGPEQVTTVNCAAEAIKALAQAADQIPNSGGWLGAIVGENDIGTFGAQLPILGECLNGFVTNLGTFGDEQIGSAKAAAAVIQALAEAADKIPNTGGWWAKITGDNSISEFGGYLPDLGTNLAGFITNLGEFTDGQVQTAKCAADALQALAGAADKMPTGGGWWQKLVGDKTSLEEFGGQLPKVAKSLKGFVSELGTFDAKSIETVKAAVGAVNAFAELAGTDLSSLSANLPTFGEKLEGFAGKIKTFASNMSSVDAEGLNAAIANVDKLIDMFKRFGDANADAASAFSNSLETIGKAGVTAFVNAFTNAADKVKTAGKQMMDNLVDGASSKASTVVDTFEKIASDGASATKEKYQSFYNAGSHLVSGFVAGISENDYKAEAQARAMARAAAQAAEDELDINSPSKVFRKIGTSIPEGFAQGIDKLGGVVTASSEAMGDTAIDGVKQSIVNLGKAVTMDIDTQPTIRPVLDLSDVKTGVNAIDGMFGNGTSIGVMANVRSIDYSMNHRNQNGGNEDVVNAIGQLHDDLGNIGQTTYTIGNITLSGDDEVAAAFETIIRAARIERRT